MTDEFDDDEYWVSKTDLKKEAAKAQAIGEQLLNVNEQVLQDLNLDEALVDAIVLAKRIKHHGGKRRQLQLVGKLMRREDLAPIEKMLNSLYQAKTEDRNQHHQAERLRDHLIEKPADAERLLSDWEPAQISKIKAELKQLANSKAGSPNHKKHARNVFRLLRDGQPQ